MLDRGSARALDRAVLALLAGAAPSELEVIGAGELTCVLGWRGLACKRLPPSDSATRIEAYGALVGRYVGELVEAGVPVAPTEFVTLPYDDGSAVGYVVQPRVPASDLLPVRASTLGDLDLGTTVNQIVEFVDRTLGAGLGIDAQLSNWALVDDVPTLLDVTTPMVRDEAGRDLLDTGIFLATLPIGIRQVVSRFMVDDLLEKNFDRRSIFLDLVGNLENYGLADRTGLVLDVVNDGLRPKLSLREIQAYRRSERWTWRAMRWALRAEQGWRTRVLRQTAQHLLPSTWSGASEA